MALPIPGRARVVLVEDDPSIRRFVEMALEDLPVDVVPCASLAAGRAALAAAPAALVLVDLRLPDGSGLDLVAQLAAAAAPGPRVAVFSASVDAAARERLRALGDPPVLPKPLPLQMLRDCVTDALVARLRPPAPPPVAGPADAVARHFGGDAELYEEFRAACVARFAQDVAEGDAALARGDRGTVLRLAHSLATVLLTLGHDAPAAGARRLESDCAHGEPAAVAAGWASLRAVLDALARDADLPAA